MLADLILLTYADLKALERWQEKWQLRFNPVKCKVLHICGNDNPLERFAYQCKVIH